MWAHHPLEPGPGNEQRSQLREHVEGSLSTSFKYGTTGSISPVKLEVELSSQKVLFLVYENELFMGVVDTVTSN